MLLCVAKKRTPSNDILIAIFGFLMYSARKLWVYDGIDLLNLVKDDIMRRLVFGTGNHIIQQIERIAVFGVQGIVEFKNEDMFFIDPLRFEIFNEYHAEQIGFATSAESRYDFWETIPFCANKLF